MKDHVKGITIEIERSHKYEKEILRTLKDIRKELIDIKNNINRIDAKIPPIDLADSIFFNLDDGQEIKKMIRTDEQTDPVHVKLTILDKKGKPAKVDGLPVWESTDAGIATVVADADGMGAMVTPLGELGECLVTAKADADLGAGVKEIVGTMPVVVTAGEAVEMAITEG